MFQRYFFARPAKPNINQNAYKPAEAINVKHVKYQFFKILIYI